MDPHQFDSVARVLGDQLGRRRLGRAVLTALLSAAGIPLSASAACKKVGRNCDKNKDCCDHAKCKSKKCRCKDGFKNCDDKCFNLDTDEQHCGHCNTTCTDGDRCCDGHCVNLDTSNGNCGACDAACAGDKECVGGTCVTPPSGCAPGADSCATNENFPCGNSPNCECKQTTEGTTFCTSGTPIPGVFCGSCNSTEDCVEFGPTAVCIASTSTDVCCGPSAQNVCALPCPD